MRKLVTVGLLFSRSRSWSPFRPWPANRRRQEKQAERRTRNVKEIHKARRTFLARLYKVQPSAKAAIGKAAATRPSATSA